MRRRTLERNSLIAASSARCPAACPTEKVCAVAKMSSYRPATAPNSRSPKSSGFPGRAGGNPRASPILVSSPPMSASIGASASLMAGRSNSQNRSGRVHIHVEPRCTRDAHGLAGGVDHEGVLGEPAHAGSSGRGARPDISGRSAWMHRDRQSATGRLPRSGSLFAGQCVLCARTDHLREGDTCLFELVDFRVTG